MNSVLDEIRNVVGDHYSDSILTETVLQHKLDYESSLDAILTNQTPLTKNKPAKSPKTSRKTSSKRQKALASNAGDYNNVLLVLVYHIRYILILCIAITGRLLLQYTKYFYIYIFVTLGFLSFFSCDAILLLLAFSYCFEN